MHFIIILLITTLVLTGCSALKKNTATKTTTKTDQESSETIQSPQNTLSSISPTSFDQSISDYLTQARSKAKDWQEDAVLHYVSVEIPRDLSLNNATHTFVFGSPKAPDDWWTFSITEKTGKSIRALIPKADYLGTDIAPMNTQYWKMNYTEAFQLAEANGGADFRKQNADAAITLYLQHREPKQWLWWTIEYKTTTGDLFTLLVNPNRGEVLDSSGQEIAPPPTGSTSN